ncbi:MAG: thioredoxin domain-containing protein [Bryobacterales bacterium]|nr:thioredoxin domain-containing protein [Bryobacterales bacterium]
MPNNRLISEKSPYLLQHAHNPVDWFPWGEEAFAKARAEDKPIFLSVGYSTCHWCHVMERESFETEELAALLNASFVPVKLDREERPDIDRVYMTFVQATTGGGGWPMSVFLTPDLKPFFGGTYFPPEDRWGRPGFRTVLNHIATHWKQERARILSSSEQVMDQLKEYASVGSSYLADPKVVDSCFHSFRRGFDRELGGFGGAPKFPRPSVLNFLLRYSVLHRDEEALEMVTKTLEAMAAGGMNDQLAGGFHRYSVDEHWFVPHFEKMLYDQAQLAIAYLEAFQATGREDFAQEARRIFRYVQRDMTDASGAFHSAEDADSVIHPASPHEKGEGAFYIYSYEAELVTLLGEETAGMFAYCFGASPDGNVAHDPHSEFTGRNILFRARTLEECAARFEKPLDEVRTILAEAEQAVLAMRNKRPRPHLDDKVLSSWNGLMISAFAAGARILGEPALLTSAQRAAAAILTHLYDSTHGILLRRMRDGEAAIDGFLDDYACVAQGLLDLYEADFDPNHIVMALHLTERMIHLFEDTERGAFYSATAGDESLILRMKEDYDGAEPSGNSVAVLNLLRLSAITGRDDLRATAERALKSFGQRLSDAPSSLPQLMVAYLFYRATPKQIVVSGGRDNPATEALLREVNARFLPNRVLLLADERNRQQLASVAPALLAMQSDSGTPAAFVCEHFTCQLPVSDSAQLRALLQ